MARHLHLLRNAAAGQTTETYAGAAALVILCAFAVMACAHREWRRLLVCGRSRGVSGPVISVHQVQPGVEGDVCIWQRSILMGGKCELPDFSGIINYDAAGNLVKKPSILDELRALQ
ncbi:hypothetical protein Taro_008944 [Colocasia esculenta]|uniref:Uncharacterized protein n=1 Tax=Colocasia esculenta TaxID=4460 RepID=A0A843TZ02_COLES|nr:hypothetical protein [Colocasia esculenta]